jgi:hypothetical protein
VSVSGSPDLAAETPPAVRLGDRLRSLDARRVSPGLWSVLEGGRQSEVVVELRGKSGIDVVTRGVRHALKWKLA